MFQVKLLASKLKARLQSNETSKLFWGIVNQKEKKEKENLLFANLMFLFFDFEKTRKNVGLLV